MVVGVDGVGNVVVRVDTRGDGNVRQARVQFRNGRQRGLH